MLLRAPELVALELVRAFHTGEFDLRFTARSGGC